MSREDPRYWISRVALVGQADKQLLHGFVAEKPEPFQLADAGVYSGDELLAGVTVATHQHGTSVRIFHGIPAADGTTPPIPAWSLVAFPTEAPEVITRGNLVCVRQSGHLRFFSGITTLSTGGIDIVPDADGLQLGMNVGVAVQRSRNLLFAYSAYTGRLQQAFEASLDPDDTFAVGGNVALAKLTTSSALAFHALLGRWYALGHAVASGDVCRMGTNVVLVARQSTGQIHVLSGVRAEDWKTDPEVVLSGNGDEVITARGNVALVASPSRKTLYAYSAITGNWTSTGYTPASKDEYMVGYDAWDVEVGD
jgi:hypothetical protein